jgi:hypothetical protein
MAHFVKLNDNNIIEQVIVVHNNELLDETGNESEQKGIDFCIAHYEGRWIQTSYNANFRKNYAGVGFLYDPIRDAFIPPKKYESWILDEETCRWTAPIPMPNDEKEYYWSEEEGNWLQALPDSEF